MATLQLRILNIQVAHLKVRLMTMCKKCHVIHEDRQYMINIITFWACHKGNIPKQFYQRFKPKVECCQICVPSAK